MNVVYFSWEQFGLIAWVRGARLLNRALARDELAGASTGLRAKSRPRAAWSVVVPNLGTVFEFYVWYNRFVIQLNVFYVKRIPFITFLGTTCVCFGAESAVTQN